MTVRWAFWLASPASPPSGRPTRPSSAQLFGREAREHPRGEVLMSRRFRRLIPSPAMIVALVALVISLGSSAYALTEITSQQITNDSLTGADIKDRSLRGHDLRKNSVGRLAINESRLRSVHSAKGLQIVGRRQKGRHARARAWAWLPATPRHARRSTGIYRVTFNRDVAWLLLSGHYREPGHDSPSPGQSDHRVRSSRQARTPYSFAPPTR